LHDCESVTPTFDRSTVEALLVEALLLVCPLHLVSEIKKIATPTFDRSVGRGLNFGNLVVMIVFRFNGGISFELSGPILIWARSTFCHFTIHPPTDGTSEESELAHFLVL
jgi:hypothetical protein